MSFGRSITGDLYHRYGGHPNERGNALVAGLIHDELIKVIDRSGGKQANVLKELDQPHSLFKAQLEDNQNSSE